MNKKIRLLATMLLLAVCCGIWAEEVTYQIKSTKEVTTSGTAPSRSSATFETTYTSASQLTGGNSQTLTLSGYSGVTISKITLEMKSNSSKGAGKLSYSTDGGTSYTYIIGSSSAGVKFNNAAWHGAWSTSWVDVAKEVSISPTSSDLIIKLEATENSLYCSKYTLTYETGGSSLTASDLTLTNSPIALSFDLYNNSDAQTISYTTSGTGDVTIGSNDYVEAVVDAATKTISVTPKAVTGDAQTITVRQAADATYAAGSATFTVTITDATPESTNFTWNLATNSYDANPTEELISWTSDYATMKNEKGESTTAVTNYIPTSKSSTRFYGKSVLTITPVDGYTVQKVVFTATTEGYATALKNSTWTNATAVANGTTVTVTPTDGTIAFSATIGATCGFTAVKVFYESAGETYALTVNAENGSVVVADRTITDGVYQVAENGTVTATATADTHYSFVNWTAEGVTLSDNTANPLTFSMPAAAVTLTANFAEAAKHNATFYVNGVATSLQNDVYEGDAITFPEDPTLTGYAFIGWATAAIDGTATTAPTTVTSATMGNADVEFYAVFGKETIANVTATFDAADISNLTASATRTWTDNATGIELYISNGQRYTSGTPNTWTVTKSTSSSDYYLSVGKAGCNINSVEVTVTTTDYAVGDYYAYATVDDENGTDLTSSVSTDGLVSTLTLDGSYEQVLLWSSTSNQIRATLIVVNATQSVMGEYVTTIAPPTVKVTSAGYATYVAEDNVYFPSTVTAFVVNGVTTTSVQMSEVVAVKKGTPVVVKAAEGEYELEVVAADDCDEIGTNLLQVSDGTVTDGVLVLANKSKGVGFYKWTGGTLPAGKVYLENSANAREYLSFGEIATAIDNAEWSMVNGERSMFNLNGQKVNGSYRGIVVANGKKYMNQ